MRSTHCWLCCMQSKSCAYDAHRGTVATCERPASNMLWSARVTMGSERQTIILRTACEVHVLGRRRKVGRKEEKQNQQKQKPASHPGGISLAATSTRLGVVSESCGMNTILESSHSSAALKEQCCSLPHGFCYLSLTNRLS